MNEAWIAVTVLQSFTAILVAIIGIYTKRIHHEVNSKTTAMMKAISSLKEENTGLRVDAAVNQEQKDQENRKQTP